MRGRGGAAPARCGAVRSGAGGHAVPGRRGGAARPAARAEQPARAGGAAAVPRRGAARHPVRCGAGGGGGGRAGGSTECWGRLTAALSPPQAHDAGRGRVGAVRGDGEGGRGGRRGAEEVGAAVRVRARAPHAPPGAAGRQHAAPGLRRSQPCRARPGAARPLRPQVGPGLRALLCHLCPCPLSPVTVPCHLFPCPPSPAPIPCPSTPQPSL